MKTLRSILVSASFTLFGLLVALIVTEIGFRLVMMKVGTKTAWDDRPKFYFAPEKAETLQDYPHSAQKVPNTFRIAVIGDSYTFAPYMQFTDAFPKIMERMLNLNDVPLKAEVINYGVPAYSTRHEVPVVKRAIDEGADLIILQITLNDPELKPYTPTGIRTDLPDRFGEYKATGWKATLLQHWKSARYVLGRFHNTATYRNYKEYFINLFENSHTWNPFQNEMQKIAHMCKDNKRKLVAVVFPLFGLPLDDSYPFHGITKKTTSLLDSLVVPNLDLYYPYARAPLDRIQVIPGVDRHPNEIAHRIAAEEIYSWLAKNNFIPDEFKIRKRYKTRIGIIKQPPYEGE